MHEKLDDFIHRLARLERDFATRWQETTDQRLEILKRFESLEVSFGKLWAAILQRTAAPWIQARAPSGRTIWEEVTLLSIAALIGGTFTLFGQWLLGG